MKAFLCLLAAIGIACGGSMRPARAQAAPAVTVNGVAVNFDQPPIERAGRVYVPLRGVFERLGASVVFQTGTINATRGSTTVSLTIGNATATVDGQPQQLDSPPFVVGARTLVPLRFVAQALGANVQYDPNDNTVSITQPMPNVVITPVPRIAAPPPPPPPAPGPVSVPLVRPEPADGATVDGARPQIAATFPAPVSADSIHVRLDSRDVTAAAYVSDRSFSYDPDYDLPFGDHRVRVEGRFADGRRFFSAWTFTNRTVPAANFLRGVDPHSGMHVGTTFTVHGFTRPGSHVHLIATASDRIAFAQVQASTSIGDVIAGPTGEFGANLAVPAAGGGIIDVHIASRAPDGAVAEVTEHLLP